METTGCDAHVVALALTVNGDVKSLPSSGAATLIPEVNFAVTDAGGIEHPVIASPNESAAKLSKTRNPNCSREPSHFPTMEWVQTSRLEVAGTLSYFPAPDNIRAPNCELDQGCEKMQCRLELTDSLAIARR